MVSTTAVERDYYHTLYAVARAVTSTLSLPQVLSRIVESTAQAMDAKACSVRLVVPMGDRLEMSAAFGLSEGYLEKGPVEISKSPMDAEALSGKPVFVLDARQDVRLQYPDEVEREGIVSILAVPIKVKDIAIGVMRLYTVERRDFDSAQVEFLEAIASLGGIAIENARIYEAMEAQFEAIRREKVPWAENFSKPRWR